MTGISSPEKSAQRPRVAITGAAGNLGSLLAREMLPLDLDLNLLIHKKDVPADIAAGANITVFRTDLNDKDTLCPALLGVDTVIHLAGVLFMARPEKFLPLTNTGYFTNLLDAAVGQRVKRVILISFPHVEGESTPECPATGRLDGCPSSAHARTRLEEEKLLFEYGDRYGFEPVSLRVGMVYGKGILMIDAAQWFARHWLLGVWKEPTWIHLISPDDFIASTIAAALRPGIGGIYHIGDDGVQTLQQFLDDITSYKGNRKPWRMPRWMILAAARTFEFVSRITGLKSPLTVDFIKIGMVSYYGDTARMKSELLPRLKYPTYKKGMHLF